MSTFHLISVADGNVDKQEDVWVLEGLDGVTEKAGEVGHDGDKIVCYVSTGSVQSQWERSECSPQNHRVRDSEIIESSL